MKDSLRSKTTPRNLVSSTTGTGVLFSSRVGSGWSLGNLQNCMHTVLEGENLNLFTTLLFPVGTPLWQSRKTLAWPWFTSLPGLTNNSVCTSTMVQTLVSLTYWSTWNKLWRNCCLPPFLTTAVALSLLFLSVYFYCYSSIGLMMAAPLQRDLRDLHTETSTPDDTIAWLRANKLLARVMLCDCGRAMVWGLLSLIRGQSTVECGGVWCGAADGLKIFDMGVSLNSKYQKLL